MLADVEHLEALVRDHWATKHLKVLKCAPDVWRTIHEISRAAENQDPARNMFMPPPLVQMLGIQVVVREDAPEGWWEMIRHDLCKVEDGEVSHERCTVLGRSGVSS